MELTPEEKKEIYEQAKWEFYSFCEKATCNVAYRLCIPDVEWRSFPELIEDIKTRSPSAFKKLQTFLNAWQGWRNFHADVDAKEQRGKLTSYQQNELKQLDVKREESRKALLEELESTKQA